MRARHIRRRCRTPVRRSRSCKSRKRCRSHPLLLVGCGWVGLVCVVVFLEILARSWCMVFADVVIKRRKKSKAIALLYPTCPPCTCEALVRWRLPCMEQSRLPRPGRTHLSCRHLPQKALNGLLIGSRDW